MVSDEWCLSNYGRTYASCSCLGLGWSGRKELGDIHEEFLVVATLDLTCESGKSLLRHKRGCLSEIYFE